MSEKNTNVSTGERGCFYPIFKGIKFIIVSYVISFFLIACISALIVYTNVPQSIMTPAIKIITLFGAFLSSVLTSGHVLSKGWICGVVTAVCNVVLLHMVGAIAFDAVFFSKESVALLLLATLCGFIGGIIGVNCGNN